MKIKMNIFFPFNIQKHFFDALHDFNNVLITKIYIYAYMKACFQTNTHMC